MTIRSKQKLRTNIPFNIVLVEPEIPPNTGNIARLCAATNTKLHLVHPLGFKITDRELKRAGLDYWSMLDVREYSNWNEFCETHCLARHCEERSNEAISKRYEIASSGLRPPRNDSETRVWFISTRGKKNIWDAEFSPGDFLIFGSETKGLSEEILNTSKENVISIPMNGLTRSLNLSTAVGIVLYEAIRQVTVEKKMFEVVSI